MTLAPEKSTARFTPPRQPASRFKLPWQPARPQSPAPGKRVPADDWRALRAKLVGEGSTVLVPLRPDADWHDAVAADAEQDGDVDGAEWHLYRLAVDSTGLPSHELPPVDKPPRYAADFPASLFSRSDR